MLVCPVRNVKGIYLRITYLSDTNCNEGLMMICSAVKNFTVNALESAVPDEVRRWMIFWHLGAVRN